MSVKLLLKIIFAVLLSSKAGALPPSWLNAFYTIFIFIKHKA